eukprot:CAMPEP_0175830962 /NCGR_PEP_ID=MMETSP0107_2-20121207/14206_1 /TAXON_ID=195067 ORGANISM="Goniomonas pacifica, Strain CCMP1869" /NCGR_SAMPLE_ID=MMETSP0107_2 /ASSEMBLY_ACC=CAM_ASM_000203 /LENGTH=188 /DNA_ID=CAMNT_0017143959 /DNA_START=935 /DNA_END=1497 /DNA_ORIENTATION=-
MSDPMLKGARPVVNHGVCVNYRHTNRQLLKHGHLTKSMMAFEGRQPILLTKVPVEHQSQLGPWGGMKISQAEPELPDAEAARPMAPDDRANVNYWTQSPRLVLKRGGPSFKSAQLTGQGVPAMHARRPIVPEPTSTSRVPAKESEHEGQSQQGLTVSIPVSNLAIGVNQTQNQASSPRLLIQSPPTHR